jgi:pyroglutamyl-peptidase
MMIGETFMTKKILITGFEPFGGEKINPSFEAVKNLPDEIDGAKIVKLKLPVVFRKSIDLLVEAINAEQPDFVICVGLNNGSDCISVERVAINVMCGRDNDGIRFLDETIFEDGENAYFSNLPIRNMVEEIKSNEIPAKISNSAGTYVCNQLMYGLLYNISKLYPTIKGGFIHVPYIPEQVIDRKNLPSMPLTDIEKALQCAIKALL